MSDFLAEIGRQQDADSRAVDTLARARVGLLARPSRHRDWRPAVAVLAAAALLVVWLWPRAEPLQAHMGDERLYAGAYLQAEQAPGSVAFSDGSALELQAGAVRLAEISDARVEVVLERGVLVLVPTHGRTEWWLRAGPYTVQARGRVRASWLDGRLELTSPETVTVDGEPLSPPVAAVWSPPAASPPSLAASSPTAPAQPPVVAAASEEPTQAAPTSPGDPAPAAVAADWRTRARAGDFAGAWQLLGDDGGSTPAQDADELALLADVARLTAHPAAARDVLLRLRSAHPGSPEAARAAFVLGTLAQDVEEDSTAASQWFERALVEAPDAPLAEHARGRLLELLFAAGDPDAPRAARDYLAHHPDGAHAELAREVAR